MPAARPRKPGASGRVPPAASARKRRRRRGRKIGLLGGSFNPAHAGHRDISLAALKRLGLDEVWWMVSPQNPLKPEAGMASFAERMAGAQALARHPRIRVSDIEALLGTRFTAQTLAALRRRFPHERFVWLMGADNLLQVPQWKDWSRIFRIVPVAVLARPSYSLRALAHKAARRFAKARVPERSARTLARRVPPAWIFLHGRLNPLSASAIRGHLAKARPGGRARKAPAPRAGAGRATAQG